VRIRVFLGLGLAAVSVLLPVHSRTALAASASLDLTPCPLLVAPGEEGFIEITLNNETGTTIDPGEPTVRIDTGNLPTPSIQKVSVPPSVNSPGTATWRSAIRTAGAAHPLHAQLVFTVPYTLRNRGGGFTHGDVMRSCDVESAIPPSGSIASRYGPEIGVGGSLIAAFLAALLGASLALSNNRKASRLDRLAAAYSAIASTTGDFLDAFREGRHIRDPEVVTRVGARVRGACASALLLSPPPQLNQKIIGLRDAAKAGQEDLRKFCRDATTHGGRPDEEPLELFEHTWKDLEDDFLLCAQHAIQRDFS